MTTMIIGLALIESLAIYTLVIIFIKAKRVLVVQYPKRGR